MIFVPTKKKLLCWWLEIASISRRHFRFSTWYYLLIFSALILFYCEYLSYFVVLSLCSWPKLSDSVSAKVEAQATGASIRFMVIADPHLLGIRFGHWFDKLRREWQMYRSFQTAQFLFNPDVTFILGDLFDEGYISADRVMKAYVRRFQELFYVSKNKQIFVIPGNHDVGFHYQIMPGVLLQFMQELGISAPVVLLTLKEKFHFVMANSMAFEGDGCYLCGAGEKALRDINRTLTCLKNPEMQSCSRSNAKTDSGYVRPVLLQHFPLYRKSDADCSEPDEAPRSEKFQPMRAKWECLSKDATKLLLETLQPRAVFDGHSHHGCSRWHGQPFNFWEHTVSSFSWRNKRNPAFLLVVITESDIFVSKCLMPREQTIIGLYILSAAVLLCRVFVNIYSSLRRYSFYWSHCKGV